MIVYIANGTPQRQCFCFRLPEVKEFRRVDINVGEQVAIKDLSQPQVDAIIAQGGKFNMVHQSEMDRTGKKFCGMAYNVDKPVTGKHIEKLFHYNMAAKVEEGARFRHEAALANASDLLQKQSRGDLRGLRVSEMSIVQESGEGSVSEGFRAGFKAA